MNKFEKKDLNKHQYNAKEILCIILNFFTMTISIVSNSFIENTRVKSIQIKIIEAFSERLIARI